MPVAPHATADASIPDEPTAVLIVGAQGSGKPALTRALLDRGAGVVETHPSTYLVIRSGPVGEALAYLPGSRQPQPHFASGAGEARAPARPPRRVEVTIGDPLLRHFTLVETPCAHRLGVAGARVLTEAAERGGAVVFVTTTAAPLLRSELDLLALLSEHEVTVFFAVVPTGSEGAEPLSSVAAPSVAGDGSSARSTRADAGDPLAEAMAAHRDAIARHAPRLADAPWFTVDPAVGDVAYLRRALVEWADAEALRRAGANPVAPPGAGAVHVSAAGAGWSSILDRWLHTSSRQVRQKLADEVAEVHLRCVQDIVFETGCAGMPEALDRELHALSLRATAECDAAVNAVVGDVLRLVLGREPTEGVRLRVVTAVRRGLVEVPTGGDLARILLVTSTGGVATVSGEAAVAAMAGYATQARSPVLPPIGIGLAGGCYVAWSNPTCEVARARTWLTGVTDAVELALLADVERRLRAVHRCLAGLIGETVDHGILLA
jgi:hypothetical protein